MTRFLCGRRSAADAVVRQRAWLPRAVTNLDLESDTWSPVCHLTSSQQSFAVPILGRGSKADSSRALPFGCVNNDFSPPRTLSRPKGGEASANPHNRYKMCLLDACPNPLNSISVCGSAVMLSAGASIFKWLESKCVT